MQVSGTDLDLLYLTLGLQRELELAITLPLCVKISHAEGKVLQNYKIISSAEPNENKTTVKYLRALGNRQPIF